MQSKPRITLRCLPNELSLSISFKLLQNRLVDFALDDMLSKVINFVLFLLGTKMETFRTFQTLSSGRGKRTFPKEEMAGASNE